MFQIIPMITLSSLLLACSGSGKSNSFHEIKQTGSTESYVDEQGRKIVKTQQTTVEKHKETHFTSKVSPFNTKKQALLGEQAVTSQPKNTSQTQSNSRTDEVKHSNRVSVIQLILNDKWEYQTDKYFKEKKQVTIALQPGKNQDAQRNYHLYMFDENAYYGYYQDSVDMNTVKNHFVYSFNDRAENKGNLHQLTANYKGQFIYTTPSTSQLATMSDVVLSFKNGRVEGKVTSPIDKRTLFEVKTNRNNPRDLEFIPQTEHLDNSRDQLVIGNHSDRSIISINMINGVDGTPNKYLVGKGGSDKYWGVLGAEKQ